MIRLSAAIAAVSVRSMRLPKDMLLMPWRLAIATSSGSKPPSGPIITPMLLPGRKLTIASQVPTIPCSCSYGIMLTSDCSHSSTACLKFTGSCTFGIMLRFDCFAAFSAISCQRLSFAAAFLSSNLTTQFLEITGTMSLTPSSTAFCMMNSNFSALGRH